jgi:tripartite-type tricarboxylate transporter receptor subunit TctC
LDLGNSSLHRRPGRLGVAVRAAVLGTAVAAAAAACSTGGGGATASSSSSGSALSFYKGKTITYIVPSPPGNPTSDQIVDMQPALEKYLGATINIKYVDSGQSAVGYDATANATANGLTIGEVSPQVVQDDLETGGSSKGGITFTPTALSYIASVGNTPILLVSCVGSPIKSMSDLVAASKVSFLTPTVGGSPEFDHLLMAAYPVNHSYLSGYTTATDVQGCERGDGDVSAVPVTNWTNAAGTALASGLTPLLLSGTVPSEAPAAFLNSEAPTLAAYAKQHASSATRGSLALTLASDSFTSEIPEITTAGPAGVPASRVQVLAAAFKYAMSQPSVVKQLAVDSLGAAYLGPSDVTAYVQSLAKESDQIATFTG